MQQNGDTSSGEVSCAALTSWNICACGNGISSPPQSEKVWQEPSPTQDCNALIRLGAWRALDWANSFSSRPHRSMGVTGCTSSLMIRVASLSPIAINGKACWHFAVPISKINCNCVKPNHWGLKILTTYYFTFKKHNCLRISSPGWGKRCTKNVYKVLLMVFTDATVEDTGLEKKCHCILQHDNDIHSVL